MDEYGQGETAETADVSGYTLAEKAAAGLALLVLASLALLAVDMIFDGRLIGGH